MSFNLFSLFGWPIFTTSCGNSRYWDFWIYMNEGWSMENKSCHSDTTEFQTICFFFFFVPSMSVICSYMCSHIYIYVCLFLSKVKEKINTWCNRNSSIFQISVHYYSIMEEVLTNAYFMILHINSIIQKCWGYTPDKI